MGAVPAKSVDLVVTSPPYPMIQMWDDTFIAQEKGIKKSLENYQGWSAFEQMHRLLDTVWDEVFRCLKYGGFVCINIGDAARTVKDDFALYPNHARILTHLTKIGFTPLPVILWRKQTNAPNKFMGSGMLPAGAYVTLEHEYVLIARKGGKREFSDRQKQVRNDSAIFWEERNDWFSDVWMDLKGTVQKLSDETVRNRSGAFPFELPYRLISMFSVKGDTVLDPFMGLGTTMLAAMATGRHSLGYELEADFRETIRERARNLMPLANARIEKRLENHCRFIQERFQTKGAFRHRNRPYGFPVITSQEKELLINALESVTVGANGDFKAAYAHEPQPEFCGAWDNYLETVDTAPKAPRPALPAVHKRRGRPPKSAKPVQLTLLGD